MFAVQSENRLHFRSMLLLYFTIGKNVRETKLTSVVQLYHSETVVMTPPPGLLAITIHYDKFCECSLIPVSPLQVELTSCF